MLFWADEASEIAIEPGPVGAVPIASELTEETRPHFFVLSVRRQLRRKDKSVAYTCDKKDNTVSLYSA
jgi:hypothetical protein